MVLKFIKPVLAVNSRTYKNFGHKRQREPTFTVLWQGFLTLTFIGMGIEWKKIAGFFFGEDHGLEEAPWEVPKQKEDEKS